jgi:hypothetical protein
VALALATCGAPADLHLVAGHLTNRHGDDEGVSAHRHNGGEMVQRLLMVEIGGGGSRAIRFCAQWGPGVGGGEVLIMVWREAML